MNCFDWQNQLSDFIDGALLGSTRDNLEGHLSSCVGCNEKYSRYLAIKNQISARRRTELPIHLRQNPLGTGIRAIRWAKMSRTQWEQIPWFVRTPLEGLVIVGLILTGVSVGPRLRMSYEKHIEMSLSELIESFNAAEAFGEKRLKHSSHNKNQENPQRSSQDPNSLVSTEDEFASDEGESGSDDESISAGTGTDQEDDSKIKVGEGEIWRFNIKTVSPRELRNKIIQTLLELKLDPKTPGVSGIEAPGGVQFDLHVPLHLVLPLKKEIQKLAPKSLELKESDSVNSDTLLKNDPFTWYKSKSRSPIPAGHAHIVIWLSQI